MSTSEPSPRATPATTHRRGPFWWLAIVSGAAAALLTACRTGPVDTKTAPETAPAQTVTGPVNAEQGSARTSAATSAKAYRQSGASHLYGLNEDRIYKGRMPPLLYAVAVLNVEIDRTGRVTRLDWLRAPRHAPEVIAEIERTVRAASPFPAPARLGKVVYTDTWLWHKSGKFQLDTLTEGQD